MNPNVLDEVVNQAKNLGVAAVKLLNGSPVGDLRQIATKHMVEAGSKQSEKALEVLNRTPLGSGNVNVFIINNNGPMVIVPAADTQIPKPPLGSITSSWSELSEVSPIRDPVGTFSYLIGLCALYYGLSSYFESLNFTYFSQMPYDIEEELRIWEYLKLKK